MEPTLLLNPNEHMHTTSNVAVLKKLSEMLENSYSIFEKRNSIIKTELEGLRKDYQEQLTKLCDYLTNSNHCDVKRKPSKPTNKSQMTSIKNLTHCTLSMSPLFERRKINKKCPIIIANNKIEGNLIKKVSNNSGKVVSSNSLIQVTHSGGKKVEKEIPKKSVIKKSSDLSVNKSSNYSTSNSTLSRNLQFITLNNNANNEDNHKNNYLINLTRNKSPTMAGSKNAMNKSYNFTTYANVEETDEKEKPTNFTVTNDAFHTQLENFSNKSEKKKSEELTETQLTETQLLFNKIKEQRKFSILDVPCLTLCDVKNGLLNQNESLLIKSDYSYINSLNFSNKYIRCFYILASSNLIPLKQRLLLSSLNSQIFSNLRPLAIKNDHLNLISEKINKLNDEFISSNVNKKMLKQKVCPSKTAQHNINFITKDMETQLRNFDGKEKEEVMKIFEVIYILLNEEGRTVDKLFCEIMPKYNVHNLKLLFINVIYNKVYVDFEICPSQFERLKQIIENSPIIKKPGELIKLNIPASFLAFSIKEMYEFINMKHPETGEELYPWRVKLSQLRKLKAEQEKLSTVM